MAHSQYSNVTDELLSAYIDGVVTAAERALVEEAAANDQQVAWRLDALRRTVALLGQLSEVPLPRSFTVSEAMVVESATTSATAFPVNIGATEAPSLWERWQRFWGSGAAVWRNAAAVCAVLLLVVLVGDSLTTQQNEVPMIPLSDINPDVASVAPSSAETDKENRDADEAAEVAMAPAAVALDEAGSVGAAVEVEDAAVDPDVETQAEEAAAIDGDAVDSAEGAAELPVTDTLDVSSSDGKTTVESAQIERLPSSRMDVVAAQTGAAAPVSAANGAAMSAMRGTQPRQDADVNREPSASDGSTLDGVVAASMVQTATVAASMAPSEPTTVAAPIMPDSPLSLDVAAASSRSEMAQPLAAPARTLEAQPISEERAPGAFAEEPQPTRPPSAVALAGSELALSDDTDQDSARSSAVLAEGVSDVPEARQSSVESTAEPSSSFGRTVVVAVQVILLLLLILFVILWLRSRSGQTVAG